MLYKLEHGIKSNYCFNYCFIIQPQVKNIIMINYLNFYVDFILCYKVELKSNQNSVHKRLQIYSQICIQYFPISCIFFHSAAVSMGIFFHITWLNEDQTEEKKFVHCSMLNSSIPTVTFHALSVPFEQLKHFRNICKITLQLGICNLYW